MVNFDPAHYVFCEVGETNLAFHTQNPDGQLTPYTLDDQQQIVMDGKALPADQLEHLRFVKRANSPQEYLGIVAHYRKKMAALQIAGEFLVCYGIDGEFKAPQLMAAHWGPTKALFRDLQGHFADVAARAMVAYANLARSAPGSTEEAIRVYPHLKLTDMRREFLVEAFAVAGNVIGEKRGCLSRHEVYGLWVEYAQADRAVAARLQDEVAGDKRKGPDSGPVITVTTDPAAAE